MCRNIAEANASRVCMCERPPPFYIVIICRFIEIKLRKKWNL